MKRTREIEIAGHRFTILEIPVSRVSQLLTGEKSVWNAPVASLMAIIKSELLPHAIEGDLENLLKCNLSYSDIKLVFDAFREANPFFFETLGKVAGPVEVDQCTAQLVNVILNGGGVAK